MTITFKDYGRGAVVPEVSFDPVGRISPGLFDRHQAFFQREIQKAQVQQRTGLTPKDNGDVS